VNIAACAANVDGASSVPTFTIIEFGRAGLSVPIAVPQSPQKCLVTGVSRSLLANFFGFPSMYRNALLAKTITIFGLPPVIY